MTKLWWPATAVPPGTGPWPQDATLDNQGRTSVLTSTLDVVMSKVKLCQAVFEKATPCVLHLQVQATRTSLDTYLKQTTDFAAKSLDADQVTGQLILEYGSGSAVQTLVADLKSGSYQLPPCEQVRAFVTTSVDNVATSIPVLTITSSLAPGFTTRPMTPTYTVVLAALTTSGFAFQVPDRARFVDLWLANTSGTVKYGTGAPSLSLWGDEMTAQLVRDYTTGIYAPPYPAAMMIQDDSSESGVTVDTTVNCEAVVQFELEL